MKRFLTALALMILTTGSAFADCEQGYYIPSLTVPNSSAGANWKCVALSYSSAYCDGTGSGLATGQWQVTWTSGTTKGVAKGIASCNTTRGTYATTTNSSDSFSTTTYGNHCWCKMTEWTPSSESAVVLSGAWVYFTDYTNCRDRCPAVCGESVSNTADFRSAVFGAVQPICTACPAKPDNSTWTTGCNFACPAGQYFQSTTGPLTFPTTNGSTSTYNGSQRTWSVTWNNVGTASGQSACATSSTGSPKDNVSNSTSSSAKHCWCKVTKWDNNNLTSKWVYALSMAYGASSCRGSDSLSCASYCATAMSGTASYRSEMFATVTNPPSTTTTTCESCPSGGTSDAGATAVTQCYKPANTNYTTTAGTYHFSSNCYYTN